MRNKPNLCRGTGRGHLARESQAWASRPCYWAAGRGAIVQNKPNSPETPGGTSALGKGSYNESDLLRGSAKQSQFGQECRLSSSRFEARGAFVLREANLRAEIAPAATRPLVQTKPICPGAARCEDRWRDQSCETKPISPEAELMASGCWDRSYGSYCQLARPAKQSQFAPDRAAEMPSQGHIVRPPVGIIAQNKANFTGRRGAWGGTLTGRAARRRLCAVCGLREVRAGRHRTSEASERKVS